jgi:RNA recognition motif-containing protein
MKCTSWASVFLAMSSISNAFSTAVVKFKNNVIFSKYHPIAISSKFHSNKLKSSNQNNENTVSRIFVGNLPFSYTSNDVEGLFKSKGISGFLGVRITADPKTGKSRGFAHLDFKSPEEAKRAVETLQGQIVQGRSIKTDLSEGRDGPKRGRRVPPTSKEMSIFIGNLDYSLTNEDIEKIVRGELGEDVAVRSRVAEVDGRSRGFGHIDFGSLDHALAAVEALNGQEILGRIVNAEVAKGLPSSSPSSEAGSKREGAVEFREVSLFIGNLSSEVTAPVLLELIESFMGPKTVRRVNIGLDSVTSRPKGFAHVDMIDSDLVKECASKIEGIELMGRNLRTDVAYNSRKSDDNRRRSGSR